MFKKTICSLLVALFIGGAVQPCFISMASAVGLNTSTSINEPSEPADVSKFVDIEGHWAKDALVSAINNGLLYGKDETHAAPDDYITRAEMATFMTRFVEASKTADIGSFVDISSEDWYYGYLSRAVQMGVMSGNGNAMNPNGHITRQEAAVVFCRAFNLYGYSTNLSNYQDYSSIASYARDAMSACVGAGVIQGSSGNLEPNKELTRAEFCTMMQRLVQTYINSKVPFNGQNIEGSAVLSLPNLTLNNIIVGENLYLGDGISNQNTTLSGVTVNGSVYVRGAGKLVLDNNSTANQVVVYNPSGAVEVDSTEGTVKSTVIDTALSTVSIKGRSDLVTMNTAKAVLSLQGANVTTLSVPVMMPTINVDEKTSVRSLNLLSDATGAILTTDGSVDSVNLDCDGAEVEFGSHSRTDILSIKGDDNSIKLDDGASVDSITIDTDSDVSLITEKGAVVDQFKVGNSSADISWDCDLDSLSINDSGVNITFTSGTNLGTLYINGNDCNIVFESGASVSQVFISGNGCDVKANGNIQTITVNKGVSGTNITVGSGTIVNNSNSNVTVNGSTVAGGSSVTVDNSGNVVTPSPSPSPTVSPTPTPTASISPVPTPTPTQGPGLNQESSCVLRFASQLSSSDISLDSKLTVNDFCTTGALGSDLKVTGTFHKIDGFTVWGDKALADGYYIPVVVNSAYVNPASGFTVTVAGTVYNASNISYGSNYGGSLIVYVPLNPSSGSGATQNKVVSIKFDADGNGTNYKETEYFVDYTNAAFSLEDTFDIRVFNTKGVKGISGGEDTKLVSATVDSSSSATFKISTENLTATDNAEGVNGYWVGVSVIGPEDASTLTYTLKSDKHLNESHDLKPVSTLSVDSQGNVVVDPDSAAYTFPVFEIYFDAESRTDATIEAGWYTDQGTFISSMETYKIDMSQVKLASGEAKDVIASSLTAEKISDDYLSSHNLSTADFASGYNIITVDGKVYIAGTYNFIDLYSNFGLFPGNYVPITIRVEGLKADASVYVNSEKVIDVPVANGEDQLLSVFVPLTSLGSAVNAFSLDLVAVDSKVYKDISCPVDTSQAAVNSDMICVVTPPIFGNNEFYGHSYEDFVQSDFQISTGNSPAILGTLNQVDLGAESPWPISVGWFAPLRIYNSSRGNSDWSVSISTDFGAGSPTKNVYTVDSDTAFIDVLVPVAHESEEDNIQILFATIEVFNDKELATPVKSFTVSCGASFVKR